MDILVIDIGGTNVKLLATGRRTPVKIPSGPTMTPRKMVRLVKEAVHDWRFSVISIGYPGPVAHDRPIAEPRNLGRGWIGFNFRKALGKPVRILNDAAMQALGSYRGGHMLFLGLGTGLGTALVIDGVLEPMELAHVPYKKGRTYEDYAGLRGLERLGKKRWRKHVADIIVSLQTALEVDDVVIGGGNAKLLKKLPRGARLGGNEHAFAGGFHLWNTAHPPQRWSL